MTAAPVAEIKRMAVHDGPGLRTTVFLKGCPLRCRWCHNPECLSPEPALLYREARCSGCGRCAASCPRGAHRLEAGRHVFLREHCVACRRCADACYADALSLCGAERTTVDVFAEVMEDAVFYSVSGGGVTLSGGEPLLWPDFCREVFAAARAKNIPTALDTSAAVPWEAFEVVLPETDLLLVDFKHPDAERHRQWTGLGNERIKENLERLQDWNIPVEIRIPLVPGCNDSPEDLRRSAEFLAQLPSVVAVKLLPYHGFSDAKYLACGLPNPMPATEPPSRDQLRQAAGIVAGYGVNAVLY